MRDIEQAVVVALVMTLVLVLVGPELDRANQYAVGRLNTDMVTCINQDIVNLWVADDDIGYIEYAQTNAV